MGYSVELETGKMDKAFKRLLGGAAFGAFIKKIYDVRSAYQDTESSIATFLQSSEKASKFMKELNDYAWYNMFEFTDLAEQSKQLLAYGNDIGSIIPIIDQLSNVASGAGRPLADLVELYNYAKSTGMVEAQYLKSWARSGVVIVDILKEMGIEVDKSSVTFEHLKMVLDNVTAEGGRFHNEMANKMQNLSASAGQLADDVKNKLNEIGERYQDAMKKGIEFGSWVVNNYEAIRDVLLVLIGTYGAYRAALASTIMLQKAQQFGEGIRLIALMRKELGLLTAAQQAYNLAALKHPYAMIAAVIGGAAIATWRFVQAKKAEEEAIEKALKPLRDEFTQTNLLVDKLKNANLKEEERVKILGQLRDINPDIVKGIEDEADAVEVLTERLEEYNKAKLAEIAVKKFSLQDKFDKAVEDLGAARDKMNDKSADLILVYESLFSRFRELETKNANIPEDLQTLFNSIIDSSIPESEKVERLFAAYDAIQNKVKAANGAYTGADWHFAQNLFAGLDIGKYESALRKLDKQTENYEKKATALKSKIISIANAIYDNEEQRQEFIMSQWAIYFPDEVKAVEDAIDDVDEKTRTWKDELTELVSGEYKTKIEAATNIPEVIDIIQKAIKTEQERVRDMKPLLIKAGFDFTGMKFPEGSSPSALEQQWAADYIKAQNNLTGLNKVQTQFDIPLDTKGADAFTKDLQTKIELTKSAKEEYKKLLRVMSSEEAFKALQSVSGYANIRLEDVISTKGENEGYIQYLEAQIQTLSTRKTKEAKALVIKLQKELDNLRLENIYNAATRAAELDKLNRDYTKAVTDQIRQSQFEIRQAEIDAMDEGFAREQEQIALNYDRLIAENEQRQREWIESVKNHAKAQWLIENPDKDESQFTREFSVADLSPEQQDALRQYTDAANAYRASSERKHLDDMLEMYADYGAQRLLLEERFDKDIAALQDSRTAANAAQVDNAIAEATRQKNAALADLDETYQGTTTLWTQLFDEYANLTNQELQAIINNAREVLAYVGNTPSADIEGKFGLTREQLLNLKSNAAELGAAYDALHKKLEQFNRRNPFAALVRSAKSLRNATADIKKAREDLAKAEAAGDKAAIKSAEEKLKALGRQRDLLKGDLKSAAMSAASYLGDVGGGLQQIGEAAGDSGLASFGKTLGEVADIAGQFASGDYIGAAISAITTGLTAIFSSRAKYKAALKQMKQDLEAFAHEYKLILSDIALAGEDSINIFSEDAFERAITALREMHKMYDEFLSKVQKKDTLNFGNSFFGQIAAARKEAQGITTDLENIKIVTRHRTWFRSEKSTTLKELYPELFEGADGFNVEAARALLNTNNQLNDEAKRQIQEVIDLYDQMKEAEEAFKDYLSQTFGEIGDSLADSIVAAFEDGTDAMENWADSFNNVLKNLAKQLMTTLFL